MAAGRPQGEPAPVRTWHRPDPIDAPIGRDSFFDFDGPAGRVGCSCIEVGFTGVPFPIGRGFQLPAQLALRPIVSYPCSLYPAGVNGFCRRLETSNNPVPGRSLITNRLGGPPERAVPILRLSVRATGEMPPPTAQGHGLRNRVPTQHGAGGPLRLPPRALPGLERCGAPEALVTDSGFVFLANRANDIYRALGIRKEEIEYLCRKPARWGRWVG